MPSLSTSLNASLAASEAVRLTQAQQLRVAEEASQLRTALLRQGFSGGGSITASYTFAVNPDGSLTPTETKITAKADVSEDTQGRGYVPAGAEKQKVTLTFGNISAVRPQLSPDEELALFSSDAPQSQGGNVLSVTAQLQRSTAALYARNSDAMFNAYPLVNQAA